MQRMLGTVAGRFFVVLLLTLMAGFNIYALGTRIIHPGDWYYYTADGSQIDIRQPGSKEIVGVDLLPTASYSSADFASFNKRCEPPAKAGTPVLVEWRGVKMCNRAGYSGSEMDARRAYFKSAVDSEFGFYYSAVVNRHLAATGTALATWLGALATYFVAVWVLRPTRRIES